MKEKRNIHIDFSKWPGKPLVEIIPDLPKGVVYTQEELDEHEKQRFELATEWEKYGSGRRHAGKHYFGRMYALLYAAKYGGRAPNIRGSNGIRQIGKESRLFQPDVISPRKSWEQYTEVKANSFRGGGFSLGVLQLENYCGVILDGLAKDSFHFVNYAFFRHGERNDHRVLSDEKMGDTSPRRDKARLVRRVSCQTRDLLVLPINLLIFLLSHGDYHRIEIRDQETSESNIDSQRYFSLKSGAISTLHDEHRGIHNLMTKPATRDLCDMIDKLSLEALKVERGMLSNNFYINGRKVEPFPVTRFYMSPADEQAWLKIFRENSAEILTKWLGIDDLFSGEAADRSPF
jgi:hypothetical protein